MKLPPLDDMALFSAVAATGSVSETARRLGIVKSSLSTRLARLERQLGHRLFDRSVAGVRLTEAGRTLDRHARAMVGEFEHAIAALRETEAPQGMLRLSVPAGIVDALILPVLTRFRAVYPGIALDVTATDDIIDLEVERVDAALRVGWIADGRFVARRLATLTDVICAAPSYLAAAPPLETPSDLLRHAWIGFRAFGLHQPITLVAPGRAPAEMELTCRIATTSGLQIKHWALAGAGVCRMPLQSMPDDLAEGRLVRALPDYRTTPDAQLYLVYRVERQRPANARRLIDFIIDAFK